MLPTRLWVDWQPASVSSFKASTSPSLIEPVLLQNFNCLADCGDYVVVTNASKLVFTGEKATDKLYRRHTFWPGGLKTQTARQLAEKDPCAILWKAVSGMLPKNRLRKERLSRLKIFAEGQHPYAGCLVKSYLPSPFNQMGKRL